MCKEKIDYIDFDDFVNNAGVKESTIKRRYKQIPGITKTKKGFRVISGTRYPYNIGNTKLDSSAARRCVLLKAISKYQYISHKELKIKKKRLQPCRQILLLMKYQRLLQ